MEDVVLAVSTDSGQRGDTGRIEAPACIQVGGLDPATSSRSDHVGRLSRVIQEIQQLGVDACGWKMADEGEDPLLGAVDASAPDDMADSDRGAHRVTISR